MKHCPGLLKESVSSLTAPTRSYIVKGWASVSSLTGKNPNKVQGNDDVSMWRDMKKKSEPWCVSGVSGHGGWRGSVCGSVTAAKIHETTIDGLAWRQDSAVPFTLQKPQHKELKQQGNGGVHPGCTLAFLTKYGLPSCLIWGSTSRRSLYKAGNPQSGTLTAQVEVAPVCLST